ncbi:hypothetical protein LCGC14_1891810, partial [marine sediment metagenome]
MVDKEQGVSYGKKTYKVLFLSDNRDLSYGSDLN